MNRILITFMLLIMSFSVAASDRSTRGEYAWSPDNVTVSAPPPMLDDLRESSGSPIHSIQEASLSAPGKLESIRAWNQGNQPLKIGFSHTLDTPARVEIDLSAGSLESGGRNKGGPPIGQLMQTTDGDVMWSATIQVDNSYRLRLHLSEVSLPPKAKLWVVSDGDEVVGPFDSSLAGPNGNIWTPSVAGPVIRLVVMLPESDPVASFNITRVAQIFRLSPTGEPISTTDAEGDLSCLKQALCFEDDTFAKLYDVENAIGRMEYIALDGDGYYCSGGLVNDNDESTTIPWFLSANHCFSSQQVASSLEVFWNYRADTCDGTKPDLATLPRSSGSTLKATGTSGDFLLLELNAIPEGRYFLGYDLSEAAIAPGSTLHRVHNPGGDVQSYSQTLVSTTEKWAASPCRNLPLEHYIWHESVIGGTIGGSSGAPVLTPDGRIVGQLFGSCDSPDGPYPQCSMDEPAIDGKLVGYWNEVAQFLDPANTEGKSDLSLTVLEAADGNYKPGDNINVMIDLANIGAETSPQIDFSLYASTDTTITSSDVFILGLYLPPLDAGASIPGSRDFQLPADIPAGTYYIGAVLKPTDATPDNNTRYDPVPITITGGSTGGGSDLSVTVLDVESGSYAPGAEVGLAVKITNEGDASSDDYILTFYASTDTTITSSDTMLDSAELPALAAGAFFEENESPLTLPANIAAGTYYIGAVINHTDSDQGNNTRYDSTPITVTGGTNSGFTVNAGLSGAWYNPSIGGQGFLLEVYPGIKFVFGAWFTFDATRPPGSYTSTIGGPGQKWLTFQGNYTSNQMELALTNTTGGVFSSGTPAVGQAPSGTVTVTFISCTEMTVAWHDIPGVQDGAITLQRLVDTNVGLCNSLSQAAQAE